MKDMNKIDKTFQMQETTKAKMDEKEKEEKKLENKEHAKKNEEKIKDDDEDDWGAVPAFLRRTKK